METPYQPAPLPSQLYDHHQRSTTTRLHSYDPLTLLESEVRNPIITGSNTCDLGGLGGGGGRQPRNNSYHPDHHRSSTTYYDHNGGSGVLSGTTSHHLSSSGSRIVDLVPRSVQESDYATTSIIISYLSSISEENLSNLTQERNHHCKKR